MPVLKNWKGLPEELEGLGFAKVGVGWWGTVMGHSRTRVGRRGRRLGRIWLRGWDSSSTLVGRLGSRAGTGGMAVCMGRTVRG